MKNTALITGASNGIGLELARIHAAKGGDLILVARSGQKLEKIRAELEEKHKVSVYLICKDLSQQDAAWEVFEEIRGKNITVEYLVNNAGFGDYGLFSEEDPEKISQMINLNIHTLTCLTKSYLPEMIKSGKGRIMNVASTAAFQPGPLLAVYSATKAYVMNFSEAINNEVRKSGVTVTAFCPGPTESGFQAVAMIEESKLVKGKTLPSSREVALYGYKAMMKGKTLAIHGLLNWTLAMAVRFLPRSMVVKVVRKIQNKSEK